MYKGINTTLDEGQTPIVTIGGGFDAAQPIPYDLYQITAPVNRQNRKPGDPCHTLARDNAAHAAVAIQDVRAVEKAQNGRGWNDDGSAYTVDTHATQSVAVAIQGTVIGRSETAGPQGSGADDSGAMFTLTKTDVHAVAFGGDIARTSQARHDSSPCADRGMDVVAIGFQDDATPKAREEVSYCLRSEAGGEGSCVMTPTMQVRRLTPVECERLQGFPDGYTNIPWRGKPESPDGPRYKALGNSMAVPVMRWIGERINEVNKL
jgi:site-specific DNA-cytosine methylase